MPKARRQLVAIWTIAITLFAAAPGLSQERLLLNTWRRLIELDTSDANLGGYLREAPLPVDTSAIALSGGRYLALRYRADQRGPTTIGVFDTRSFAVVRSLTFPGGASFVADEFRTRVFYRTPTEIGILEAPAFVPRVLSAAPDIAIEDSIFCCGGFAYAAATNSLFVPRARGTTGVEYVAFDADTGKATGVIAIDDGYASGFIVNNASRKVYLPVTIGIYETEIRAYDLDTFEPAATTARYRVYSLFWSFDVARQYVIAAQSFRSRLFPAPWIATLDRDLTVKGTIGFDGFRFNPNQLSMSPLPSTARNRMFAVLSQGRYESSGAPQGLPGQEWLLALDADSLQLLARVDLLKKVPNLFPGSSHAILLSPRPPPSPLTSSVADRRVDLTWRDPSDTTHYIVEVGTVPGRSNVGMLHVGNTTAWSADGVPPGTYYVRVRAINDVGLSLPSNEVVVTVP